MSAIINGWKVQNIGEKLVVLSQKGQRKHNVITVAIPEIVRHTGGTFEMGSTKWKRTQPLRKVTVSDFGIGKFSLTNEEYLDYLKVMGTLKHELSIRIASKQFAKHPALLSWYDAERYCEFLRNITTTDYGVFRDFQIPTEAQWEYAARGTRGWEYPYGPEFYKSRQNWHWKSIRKTCVDAYYIGTTPVDAYPSGATPTGLWDMSGNIWELARDW